MGKVKNACMTENMEGTTGRKFNSGNHIQRAINALINFNLLQSYKKGGNNYE